MLAGMWNRPKLYVAFCRLAFQEFKTSKGVKWMRYLYGLGLVIIVWVLDLIFGIPVVEWGKAILDLLTWYWWIVIFLSLVILFLLFIVEGARRFHERTVAELNARFDDEIKEANRRALVIELLSMEHGKAAQIYDELIHDRAVSKDKLDVWHLSLENTIRDTLGADALAAFNEGYIAINRRDFPEELHDQERWVNGYLRRVHALIKQQHWRLIAHKEDAPKQLT